MPPDREAILARCALFVGSALAGFARPVRAEDVESCLTPEPASEADRQAAKALFQEGMTALQRDDAARAAELWRDAYARVRMPKLLLCLADAEAKAGNPSSAHARLTLLRRCADSPALLSAAERELAKLE